VRSGSWYSKKRPVENLNHFEDIMLSNKGLRYRNSLRYRNTPVADPVVKPLTKEYMQVYLLL